MKYYEKMSKERDINDILSDISDICLKHIMFNSDSISVCQKLNYQGFKRLHRHLSKKFHCMFLTLLNDSINNFDVVPQNHSEFIRYNSSSLKEHLNNRYELLLNDIKILGQLSKEFFEMAGFVNCTIKEMLDCMFRSLSKTKRAIKRFDDNNWLQHDIYVYDNYLHKKIKKKEQEDY